MENQNKKSFFFKPTIDKDGKIIRWDKREFGYTAIVGLLAGPILIKGAIGDVVALFGLICGIVWIYKTVQEKRLNKVKEN